MVKVDLRRFYVYIYLDPSQTERVPIYVGKGAGYRDREHLCPCLLNGGLYFHNKLKKLHRQGFDPQPIRILVDLTEEEALTWEKGLIKFFGRKNLGTGILYNLTDGGDGVSGLKWTDEQQRIQRYKGPRTGEYKGVHQERENRNWLASMRLNGVLKHLGSFCTPEKAARAYDEEAVRIWGGDCHLNFPGEWDGTKCLREPAERNSSKFSRQMKGPRGGKYKGAHRDGNRWTARMEDDGERTSLGNFDTEEEAARAYDEGAMSAWGQKCHLNFPKEWDGTKCLRESIRKHSLKLSLRMAGPKTGKYKGVRETPSGKYSAGIEVGATPKYLGNFDTEEEAARAYDEGAMSAWGQKCHLNFPKEWDGTKCLRKPVVKNSLKLSLRMAGPRKGGKYKGVNKVPSGKYRASIRLDNRTCGRTFDTEEEAAYARDQAVIEHLGHGWLNFPTDQPGEYTGFWDENNPKYKPDYLGDSDA